MIRTTLSVGLAAAALLAAAGCGGDGVRDSGGGGTMGGGPSVAFATLQDTLFTPSCALVSPPCHVTGVAQAGLDLSAGQAYANLVGVPSAENPSFDRVERFDPDASYLYLKITGDPQISGSQMPLVGGPLTAQQIADVATWILEGAEDN